MFAPLATCGAVWAHRRMRDNPSKTEAALPASNNESNESVTRSDSQQRSASTLSAQPVATAANSNSNSGSSPGCSQLSGTPAPSAPASSKDRSVSTSCTAQYQLQPQPEVEAEAEATPAIAAVAPGPLDPQSTPAAHPEAAQEKIIEMKAVRDCLAEAGPTGAHEGRLRPFSASQLPLSAALDAHNSNPLLHSVLAQHNMLTDVPEVCCPILSLCMHAMTARAPPHDHRCACTHSSAPFPLKAP